MFSLNSFKVLKTTEKFDKCVIYQRLQWQITPLTVSSTWPRYLDTYRVTGKVVTLHIMTGHAILYTTHHYSIGGISILHATHYLLMGQVAETSSDSPSPPLPLTMTPPPLPWLSRFICSPCQYTRLSHWKEIFQICIYSWHGTQTFIQCWKRKHVDRQALLSLLYITYFFSVTYKKT